MAFDIAGMATGGGSPMNIAGGGMGGGGFMGIGSAVLGGLQTIGSLIGLSQLGPKPTFTASPDLMQATEMYRQMANQGFTPQEQAAYQSQIARQSNAAFQRGLDLSGGNMAQALQASQGANQLGAANQLAAQDAALRRQNLAGYAGQADKMQRIQDMNTQAQLQQRQAAESALGMGLQSGLTNLAGTFNYNQALGSYRNTMLGDSQQQPQMNFGVPGTKTMDMGYTTDIAAYPTGNMTTQNLGQSMGYGLLQGLGQGISGFGF